MHNGHGNELLYTDMTGITLVLGDTRTILKHGCHSKMDSFLNCGSAKEFYKCTHIPYMCMHVYVWWCHNKIFSMLLVPFDMESHWWIPLTKAINASFDASFDVTQTNCCTLELSVIWCTMMLMWHHPCGVCVCMYTYKQYHTDRGVCHFQIKISDITLSSCIEFNCRGANTTL